MIEQLENRLERMSFQELKSEIEQLILGSGMGGSSQYVQFKREYYDEIKSAKLKNAVGDIVIQLAKDIDCYASSRAIYLCDQIFNGNAINHFVELIGPADKFIECIMCLHEIPDNEVYKLDYIYELNRIVSKYKLTQASGYLIKQLEPLKGNAPHPTSNRYYLYQLSAKSALQSLKVIDFSLASSVIANLGLADVSL